VTATEARERKVAFSVHFCIYGRTLHVGHGEGPFGESARLGTVSWYEVVRIWGSGCDSFFDELGPQQLGTLGRASGCAGASARAWGPSTQPLASEVSLRTSGPLRPPSDERWGTPEVDRTLRLAKGRTGLVFGAAQHEQASSLSHESSALQTTTAPKHLTSALAALASGERARRSRCERAPE
jgi:hypothetical protein